MQSFLKNLFTWRGRLSRRYFCYYFLGYIVLAFALRYLGVGINALFGGAVAVMTVTLLSFVLIAAMLCQIVRRYHDFGVTGWVPVGFFLFGIVMNVLRGPAMPLGIEHVSLEVDKVISIVLQVLALIIYFFVPALIKSKQTQP